MRVRRSVPDDVEAMRAIEVRAGERFREVGMPEIGDVPWNGPLYRHLGFRDLGEAEIGPGLAAVRDHEAEAGLDPATRICMRRDL